MKQYSINLTKEEKKNILDQHKNVYDGFVTQYVSPNQQPLYVQDFANDKDGITVSNKGVVKTYMNMNINEDVYYGAELEPKDVQYEDEEIEEMHDMIGDGEDDLKHGVFDDEEEEFPDFFDSDFGGELELDDVEIFKEDINEKLRMFRRFKNR